MATKKKAASKGKLVGGNPSGDDPTTNDLRGGDPKVGRTRAKKKK